MPAEGKRQGQTFGLAGLPALKATRANDPGNQGSAETTCDVAVLAEPPRDELALSLAGVEPPVGMDEAIVALTVDHLALYDSQRRRWVPLVHEAVDLELLFETGYGDPALLTVAPLVRGNYTDAEIVVRAAHLITESGTTEVRTDDFACYTPITLRTEGIGALHELELLVSGPEALERSRGQWRFRPALVGSIDRSSNVGRAHCDEAHLAAY